MVSQEEMPFSLKLSCLFFSFDGLKRSLLLCLLLVYGAEGGIQIMVFHGLWICTDALLLVLIGLRANAARYWLILVLLVHGVYLLSHIALRQPLLWVTLGSVGRLRLVAALVIDAILIHFMLRESARDYLVE